MIDPSRVEERVEQIIADSEPHPPDIRIDQTVGGMHIETARQLDRIAVRLSKADVGVPPHCRGQPAVVYAILMQAQEWGLPFMSVINQSYVTRGKGGIERLAYQAMLIHTLIETRADLKEGLRGEYIGEGEDMICRVTGHRRNELEPRVWESEKLGKIVKDIGFNDANQFKGSPEWIKTPKKQLFYSTSRDWGRVHTPWVILGVYTPDEIEQAVFPKMTDVTPANPLVEKLRAARAGAVQNGRGFNAEHVAREAAQHETGANPDAGKQEVTDVTTETDRSGPDDVPGVDRPRPVADDRADSAQDQERSGSAHRDDSPDGGEPAGDGQAAGQEEQDQAEIFPPDRKPPAKPRGRK